MLFDCHYEHLLLLLWLLWQRECEIRVECGWQQRIVVVVVVVVVLLLSRAVELVDDEARVDSVTLLLLFLFVLRWSDEIGMRRRRQRRRLHDISRCRLVAVKVMMMVKTAAAMMTIDEIEAVAAVIVDSRVVFVVAVVVDHWVAIDGRGGASWIVVVAAAAPLTHEAVRVAGRLDHADIRWRRRRLWIRLPSDQRHVRRGRRPVCVHKMLLLLLLLILIVVSVHGRVGVLERDDGREEIVAVLAITVAVVCVSVLLLMVLLLLVMTVHGGDGDVAARLRVSSRADHTAAGLLSVRNLHLDYGRGRDELGLRHHHHHHHHVIRHFSICWQRFCRHRSTHEVGALLLQPIEFDQRLAEALMLMLMMTRVLLSLHLLLLLLLLLLLWIVKVVRGLRSIGMRMVLRRALSDESLLRSAQRRLIVMMMRSRSLLATSR